MSNYPPLPKPFYKKPGSIGWPDLFTAAQMHAYVDTDRKLRTNEPQASDDARDAARYRYIRDTHWDAIIDAELAKEQPK